MKHLKVAVFSMLSCVAFLGMLELFVRAVSDLPVPMFFTAVNRYVPRKFVNDLHVTAEINTKLLRGLTSPITVTTNAFGLRSLTQKTLEKPAGTLRIAFVGGSTTECGYLDDRDTWSYLVGESIRAQKRNIQIEDINAGVSGANTRDHLSMVSQYLIPMKPDVLVFMTGVNDAALPLRTEYDSLRDDVRSRFNFLDWFMYAAQPYRSHLLRALSIAMGDGLTLSWRGIQPAPIGAAIDRLRKHWRTLPYREVTEEDLTPKEEYEQNLRSLIGIAKAQGIRVVLSTQQTLYGDAPSEKLGEKSWQYGRNQRFHSKDLNEVIRRYNEVNRKVAKSEKLALVDLEREIPKDDALFYDEMHVTPVGAKAFAEQFSAVLKKVLK